MLTYIVIFYRRFHPLSSQEVNRLPLSHTIQSRLSPENEWGSSQEVKGAYHHQPPA